jgi:DNA-binding NarL/FixJ family response regulator
MLAAPHRGGGAPLAGTLGPDSSLQKILIADDSEPMRKLHRDMAAQSGRWRLCGEAVNGLQAVHLARALRPDLIVLDLAMPVMDGLRAAPEILKELPRVPIILYTLHEMPNLELEARKAGIREVVVKGPDIAALSNAINRLLNESAQPAQPLATQAAVPDLFPQAVVTEAARNEAAHAAASPSPQMMASEAVAESDGGSVSLSEPMMASDASVRPEVESTSPSAVMGGSAAPAGTEGGSGPESVS